MLEVLEFDVRVEFGGVEVAVAEQLLHVPEAGAATQEMRRARVAKRMHRGLHFSLQSVVTNAVSDHLIRQAPAGDSEPERRRRRERPGWAR